MNRSRASLETFASELGLALPAGAQERFARYLREILRWRTRLSLTTAATHDAIVAEHLWDSLLPLAVWPLAQDARVVDIGSGAGFPGVPMKIVRPDLTMVLVEASRRRVAFLEHLRDALELKDLQVEWARSEDLGRREGFREAFAAAVERATAKLAAAVEVSLPFVRQGGAAVLLKGPSVTAEVERAVGLIARLGGSVEQAKAHRAPGSRRATVAVVIRKVGQTPAEYPRRGPRRGRP